MQLSLNKFNSDCFNQANLHIIATNDESIALQDYIVNQLIENTGFIIHNYLVEKNFSFMPVIDILSAGSLFSDANCIILSFKTKPTAEQIKVLLTIYALLNDSNKLIIKMGKIDKKDANQEWLTSAIIIQLSGELTESEWLIKNYLSKYKITLDRAANQLLLEYTQRNLTQLLQELRQISLLFKPGDNLNKEQLIINLADSSNYTILNLSSAYLRGDLNMALKILDNIYREDSDLILVIWILTEDVTRLIQVKAAAKKGINLRAIAPSLRIWGSSLADFEIAHKRVNYALLIDIINRLANIDMVIKGLISGDVLLDIKIILTMFTKKD